MTYRTIAALVLLLCLHAVAGHAQKTDAQSRTLHSAILDEDRNYQIQLPASYGWAADRRYPVLFVLDGETHFQHTAASAAFLAAQGEIPECIVVAITSTVRIRDFTQTDWPSHWIGGGGAGKFRDFLARELLPEIDQEFRTNGYRMLAGHSASGQFVLYALSSEPALFNAYFAVSPSLDWDDFLPQRSLEASLLQKDSLRAFLYFAWSDDFDQALAADLKVVETLEHAAPKGFRWVGKAYPEETHGSIPLLGFIDALRRLFTGYRFHDDLLGRGLAFAETHFRAVSDTVGYRIPIPEEVINSFGYDALNSGDIDTAISLFQRNIDQNPNSANAFDSLSDAYEAAQRWSEAGEAIATAVALARKHGHPNYDDFLRHASRIAEKARAAQPK